MEVFVAVARDGSFSAAARKLRVTRSAVCRRIERLEDRLGVRLLNRTTRQLSVTEAGRMLYESGVVILAELERVEGATIALQQSPKGTLKVLSPVMIGLHIVVPMAREFLAAYPSVTVELSLSDDNEYAFSEFDVIVAFGEQPNSSLMSYRVGESRRVICASPDYLAARGPPRRPEDLLQHNCLLLGSLGTSHNEWTFRKNGQLYPVRVSGSFVGNSGSALYEAMLAGIGVARATDLRVRSDVGLGRVVLLLEPFQPEDPTPIYALHHSKDHVAPKVRAFIEYLRRALCPSPPLSEKLTPSRQ
jgi:DNA-binding transcriptional LysR family regulator